MARRSLACGVALMITEMASVFAPCLVLAQSGSPSEVARLESFAGTWTARNAGESTPYFTLKLTVRDGKLTGSVSHVKFRVIDNGKLIGTPGLHGEVPIANPTITLGDLNFGWEEDPPFPGARAELTVEGTQVAQLVFVVPPGQAERIMAENSGVSGFNPIISVRRETRDTGFAGEGVGSEQNELGDLATDWQVKFMVRLINRAEVLYKIAHGRYADYATLLDSGQIKEASTHFTVPLKSIESRKDPLPGYDLRLRLATDNASYQLYIKKKSNVGCAPAILSDQRGIMFEGRDASCESPGKPVTLER